MGKGAAKSRHMGIIRTVTGDCAPQDVGYCQCHEHLFIAKGKSFDVNPALWMDDEEASLAEVLLYKAAGGKAIVDAQPVGAGSMPQALIRVSEKSGVKIVASTGFHKLIFYSEDHFILHADEKVLQQYFIADLEQGMAVDADVDKPKKRCCAKAGIIKCALDKDGLDYAYTRLFKAAAGAALATGAPMLIHTEDGVYALELINYLKSLGLPSNRIILCHIERSVEPIEEKLKIVKTGVYIECDTIARFKYHSDEDGALFIKRLCDEGFENRILLGLDTTRQRMKSYGGITGLDYILTNYIPLLERTGVTKAQLHKFCNSNPGDALTINL